MVCVSDKVDVCMKGMGDWMCCGEMVGVWCDGPLSVVGMYFAVGVHVCLNGAGCHSQSKRHAPDCCKASGIPKITCGTLRVAYRAQLVACVMQTLLHPYFLLKSVSICVPDAVL